MQEELLKRNTQLAAMESKINEMQEVCTKYEFSEGVQREQRVIERDQAMREVEGMRAVVAAKEREVQELKEQCADL